MRITTTHRKKYNMAFYIWECPENKQRLIDYLIHEDNEQEGTLGLLSDDAQEKITSFLNGDDVIDIDSEEKNEYMNNLDEEFAKYF
jgi:hypothetical protein